MLKDRQSVRDFATTPIPSQMLGDLLRAGYGVNRPGNGHRTALSAMNSQEIDLYVVTAQGVSVYDAAAHALNPWRPGISGRPPAVSPSSKTRLWPSCWVADLPRMTKASPQDRERYAMFDAGCISRTFTCSARRRVWAPWCTRWTAPACPKLSNSAADQRAILAHSVGYPKAAIDSSGR